MGISAAIARWDVFAPQPSEIVRLLRPVLTSWRHGPIADRRRAALIVVRSRQIAAFFAFLTLAWIAVDAITLPLAVSLPLAVGRLVVAIGFAALAVWAPRRIGVARANLFLACLFAWPVAFFVFANLVFHFSDVSGVPGGVLATYYYAPFIMAAGLAIFPLTGLESLKLAAPILVAMMAVTWITGHPAGEMATAISTHWLLLSIAGVACLAAMSQLQFYLSTVEHATRDQMTGLLSRGGGRVVIEHLMQGASRSGAPLTVVFLDLDRFKQVNDRYGHEAGDLALVTVARKLEEVFRRKDILIRWGGEEFLIACPDTDQGQAMIALGRLGAVGLGLRPDGAPQTASIGVAEYRGDESCPDLATLVDHADARMYAAKQAGRNCFVMPDGSRHDFVASAPAVCDGPAAAARHEEQGPDGNGKARSMLRRAARRDLQQDANVTFLGEPECRS